MKKKLLFIMMLCLIIVGIGYTVWSVNNLQVDYTNFDPLGAFKSYKASQREKPPLQIADLADDELIQMLNDINTYCLYDLDKESLKNQIKVVLALSLNDPYSAWLNLEDYGKFVDEINSNYGGLGVDIESIDNQFVVANVLQNSAAKEADLKLGDVLLSIEDIPLKGNYTLFETASKIYPSNYTLTIERNGLKKVIDIHCHDYNEPSLTHRAIKDFYYIDINSFSEDTFAHFEEAIRIAKANNYKKVIFDLRYNYGGWMDAAYDMLSLINDEKTIAYTHYKGWSEPIERTVNQLYDVTAYVLINNKTSSAAEMFAQGMRYHDGALLIGQKTYGKGVMQQFFDTENGVLKMTVAHFSAHKDDLFSNTGLQPDVVLQKNRDFFLTNLGLEYVLTHY